MRSCINAGADPRALFPSGWSVTAMAAWSTAPGSAIMGETERCSVNNTERCSALQDPTEGVPR